ncbi:MAG: methionine--tRNA ligase subunit beta [Nitrososphaeria archaeon]
MDPLDFEEFAKLDIRIGKVVKAEKVPNSKKLLHTEIDIGGEVKSCVGGLAEYYTPEDLIGKTVVVVTNLKPRKMFGYESQVMFLAALDKGNPSNVSLLTPDKPVTPGSKVT